MRHLFLLIFSFCCCYCNLSAQNSIVFHATMKTGSVYRQTMQMNMTIALNYDSMSQELGDALKNNPNAPNTMVINQGGNVMHVVVDVNQLMHCDISKE